MTALTGERWRALSPYLDEALELPAAERGPWLAAVARERPDLAADLQSLLAPGEAYYKMIVLDDDSYGIFVTHDSSRSFRIPASPAALDRQVDQLRATISIVENGQQLTYPFNLELASNLYDELFAPVAASVGGVHHLIMEPDGALLRLPPNLLVMDHAAVAAYRADHGGACPKSLEEIVTGGYARDLPLDAWGRPLRLSCPGRKDPSGFDLSSDGPDGEPGGLDRVE